MSEYDEHLREYAEHEAEKERARSWETMNAVVLERVDQLKKYAVADADREITEWIVLLTQRLGQVAAEVQDGTEYSTKKQALRFAAVALAFVERMGLPETLAPIGKNFPFGRDQ